MNRVRTMNVFNGKQILLSLLITAMGSGCTGQRSKAGDAGGPIVAAPKLQNSDRTGGGVRPVLAPTAVGAPDWTHASCEQFNDGGACSATEQRILSKSPSCYGCLANAGCLDTASFNDTGHECTDLVGVSTRGGKVGAKRSDLCLSTLDCILSKGCASDDVALCYCGSLGAGNGCTTATSGAKGACLQQELDGLEHSAGEPPKAVVPDYFNRLLGAGVANEIFACGRYNGCREACQR
jgi:hypothetical protein